MIVFFLVLLLIVNTGCIKRDSMEDIRIYTTVYPIEYITDSLYGEHSTIYSIYPNGVIADKYDLTDKQIQDYSKGNLFIFNGLGHEKDYVAPMFHNNKKLMIIDTTLTMEYTNSIEELWLDPSNFLMMAANIKNGLSEYINNHYLKNEIEEKYEQLKIHISNLDAKLQLMGQKSDSKKIVVSNDTFLFLEKYGIEVYSLEENGNLTDKTISDVTNLIQSGQIHYIFMKQNEDVNSIISQLQETSDVELLTLHTISNLTESERNSKKDYLSIMNDNIELLKLELYD